MSPEGTADILREQLRQAEARAEKAEAALRESEDYQRQDCERADRWQKLADVRMDLLRAAQARAEKAEAELARLREPRGPCPECGGADYLTLWERAEAERDALRAELKQAEEDQRESDEEPAQEKPDPAPSEYISGKEYLDKLADEKHQRALAKLKELPGWLSPANELHAAIELITSTWLSPAEVESRVAQAREEALEEACAEVEDFLREKPALAKYLCEAIREKVKKGGGK